MRKSEIDKIRCEAYNDDPFRVRRVAQRMPKAKDLSEASRILHALGHPVRAGIYAAITIEPLCVCELSTLFRMSPPALMYHLRLLAEAGLITVEKSGKFAEYHPASGVGKELLRLAGLHFDLGSGLPGSPVPSSLRGRGSLSGEAEGGEKVEVRR